MEDNESPDSVRRSQCGARCLKYEGSCRSADFPFPSNVKNGT